MASEVGTAVHEEGWVPDIPEISPVRLDHTDFAGIQRELAEQGFACIKECLNAEELEIAREMLWQHLEGAETPQTLPDGECHRRERPVGWKRDDVTSWTEGHGCGLMTSTVHCDAMWYTRTRVGVNSGFRAAYREDDLTAAYDRMSVNLPTATGNKTVLQKAATSYEHGKLDMMDLHTHANTYYDERNGKPFTDFYSIVPLWDMNKATGATAVVPGSHKHVKHINEMRQNMWQHDETQKRGSMEWWRSRKWTGKSKPGDFHEPFTSIGLVPSVTSVKAGDMVIFDTALYHSGCPSEDPSGRTGENDERTAPFFSDLISLRKR
jgi:hypothetical protein